MINAGRGTNCPSKLLRKKKVATGLICCASTHEAGEDNIMAPYDSDSSAGEEEDFTETNVLLGYASKEPGDDSTTRLGGRPVSSTPSQHPIVKIFQ
jgi:hypothetical protein